MRLVHLSDLHIGFRQFERTGPRGVNQRELDVEQTLAAAVDRVIAIAPDLIVVGGDVFHTPKPTPNAILATFGAFSRIVAALPEAIVVVVAGNHDVSKSFETTSMLQLLTTLGVHVVDSAAQRLYFEDRDLSVLGVPDIPNLVRPPMTPDPRATWNVAVIHGEMQGQLPAAVSAERSAIEITADELNLPAWNYVALGHWHVYQQVAPNCFYSGSIDYTSSDPWGEVRGERKAGIAGKGIIEHDLVTGAHTFHPLPVSRRYVDLPALEAHGLSPAEVDAAIRDAIESEPIDGCVVRIKVLGITREVSRELDQRAIRGYRARALNFALAEERPDRVRPEVIAAVRQINTLAHHVEEKLGTTELPNDVDRAAFVALGKSYLEQATERAGDRLTNEPVPLIPDAAPQRRAS
jgi:exonuclease SbcD